MQKYIQGLFFLAFLVLLVLGKMNLWLFLFAITWAFAAYFGRFYCGYICPMNTAMQLTTWLKKRLGIGSLNPPKWLVSPLVRGGVLTLFIGFLIFSAKTGMKIPLLLIFLGLAVLITALYSEVVFHRTFCPFGTLLCLPARFSKKGLAIQSTCIHCNLCVKACPNDAIAKSTEGLCIDTQECLQCHACVKSCRVKAIECSVLR